MGTRPLILVCLKLERLELLCLCSRHNMIHDRIANVHGCERSTVHSGAERASEVLSGIVELSQNKRPVVVSNQSTSCLPCLLALE